MTSSLSTAAFRRVAVDRLKRAVPELRVDPSPAADPDLLVLDDRFWSAAVLGGSIGIADAWARGWWTAHDLVGLLRRAARADGDQAALDRARWRPAVTLRWLRHHLIPNSPARARRDIAAHYDIGNDFFASFLDPTLTYSSGVFRSPTASMEEASLSKLELVCRKLNLAAGQRVLETGTGWGSFALHAAGKHDLKVTTTTISDAQWSLARQRVEAAGLLDQVELLRQDYRLLEGTYDGLASIEMIEAVGRANLVSYFRSCARCLSPRGRMVLQVISIPDSRWRSYCRSVDFIRTHVFPGSCCPSLGAIVAAVGDASDLRIEHLEEISDHYVLTLRHWRAAFARALPSLRDRGYDEDLLRLWDFYLAYCEAGFAERRVLLFQIRLARPEAPPSPWLESPLPSPLVG